MRTSLPALAAAAACSLLAPWGLTACPAAPPDPDDHHEHGGDPEDELDLAMPEQIARALSSDDMEGRDEGSAGGTAARAHLVEALQQCGVAPLFEGTYEQPITTGEGTNVLGVVEGQGNAERVLLISAHYDHLGTACGGVCNGALDNAAAVGAVVATACAIARAPLEKTVVVALWDAEEPPTFLTNAMGSQFFVAESAAGRTPVELDAIDVAIALDLVGGELWPGYRTHFVMGADETPALSRALDDVSVPETLPLARGGLHLIEEIPGSGRQPWSDYDAFRNRDVPTLFLSDGQNKRYHEASDDADALDFAKLADETLLLTRIVVAAAAVDEAFAWDEDGADLARDRSTVLAILDDALAPEGMVDALGLSTTSDGNLQGLRDAVSAEDESAPDRAVLEGAAIYVMCLAGSGYSESQCNMFF